MSPPITPAPAATRAPDLTLTLSLARRRLRGVGRRYLAERVAAGLLPAAAGALLLLALVRHWPALPAGRGVGLALAALGAGALGHWLWPLRRWGRPATTAAGLDRQFGALEDSAGLLLRKPEELNLLERLQQQRVARRLHALHAAGALRLPVAWRRPALLTSLLLAAAVAAWRWPAAGLAAPGGVGMRFTPPSPAARAGLAPARITATRLLVTPPAYTRQAAFAPAQASFQCPQGSRVRWQVQVSGGAGQGGNEPFGAAPELEIGGQRRRLRPVAGQAGAFFTEQTLLAPALYRLRYAGTVSDDYAIDVRADQAPTLRILTPKPYTLVAAFGPRAEVAVRAVARDDYGLRRAELVITVAQGQGEAVKFREVHRDVGRLGAGRRGGPPTSLDVRSQLNLLQLGLTPGDELYFYLSAQDNAGHAARTDAYLVQWQDTAAASSALDLGAGVKVAPAYFRSQRQLIIDTEKLLAEKARLDAPTLARRANELGADQQTLRLRYGKFMGEEVEAGMGAPATPPAPIAEEADEPAAAPVPTAEAGDEPEPAPASSTKTSPTAATDALAEPYQHRHDDAETADFLEPTVKAKLRAVLDQMWAAELRLRTGQPAAALPYEYRALRLLKQVQQQTRAYVKKAGFVAPPLPEATLRLTGELAGAAAPQRRQPAAPAPAEQPAVRAALRWLATDARGARPDPAGARQLEQAGPALAGAALQAPGRYLPALRVLRQLAAAVRAGRPPGVTSRPLVERALTELLPTPPAAPKPPPAPDRLARRYFQALGG